MLQKISRSVENLCTKKLDVGPCSHVFGKDFKVMHDRCVVPLDDTPDLAVGVQVFGVGDVGKDAASQHQFLGLDFAQDVIGADSDDLCGISENGASD
jgi:hypothetical protein